MKYKNHLRTLLSTVLVFSLFSCDLDMEPENVYVDEKVYRTQKTAEAALTGSYVRLKDVYKRQVYIVLFVYFSSYLVDKMFTNLSLIHI